MYTRWSIGECEDTHTHKVYKIFFTWKVRPRKNEHMTSSKEAPLSCVGIVKYRFFSQVYWTASNLSSLKMV